MLHPAQAWTVRSSCGQPAASVTSSSREAIRLGSSWSRLDNLRWAVLAEARTGVSADEAIRSLDYQGPWRRTDGAAALEIWETLNGVVRQAALLQLTRDTRLSMPTKETSCGALRYRASCFTTRSFSSTGCSRTWNAMGSQPGRWPAE